MGRRRAVSTAAAAASCLELSSLGRDGPGSPNGTSGCGALSDGDADSFQTDEFERRIDALFEKRGSTREGALQSLAELLRAEYRADDCMCHSETITSRCLAALKRGSSLESFLAAQLLSLHILTLGQPDESLFQALHADLERAAVSAGGGGGDDVAVQCASLDCLTLAAFVLAEEEEADTRGVMERLRSMWNKGSPKVRAAAVRGWSFLLTSLDCPNMAWSSAERGASAGGLAACLAALAGLMLERDLDLRTAAGEAVAVIRCCCGCSVEVLEELAAGAVGAEEEADGLDSGGEDEEEEEWSGGRRGRRSGSGDGSSGGGGAGGGDGMEGLLGRMQQLACNKGDKLRRSRRERASQRSTFRGLLSALRGSQLPASRIRLQHGDCLVVEGVAGNHRLAFLRRVLAGGFQAHLQRNPLLHRVFGFTPRQERPERLSAVEKRLSRSSQSGGAKARTADRRWSREAKVASRMAGYMDF